METKSVRREQTTGRHGHGFLRLPGSDEFSFAQVDGKTLIPCLQPEALSRRVGTGRNIELFLKLMAYKAIIKGTQSGGLNAQSIDYDVYDASSNTLVGANTIEVTVNTAMNSSEVLALIATAIAGDALTNFSVTVPTENVYFMGLLGVAPKAAIADAPADATTNYNVVTTLLGTLTSAVNTANTKQNQIATQLNTLLSELRSLGIIAT